MKKFKQVILASLFALPLTPGAIAAEVEILWEEPENYRDIEAVSESQVKFQRRVIQELGGYFEQIAREKLPEDEVLYLTITDVDLAGDVQYLFGRFNREIRIVDNFYYPAISFDYELRSASDGLIKKGSENIKDMGFKFSGLNSINNPPFGYEKAMIEDWFDKTFNEMSN